MASPNRRAKKQKTGHASTEESPWADTLPAEMRAHVVSFLATDDRFVLSLVSKREHAEHRLSFDASPSDRRMATRVLLALAAGALFEDEEGGGRRLAWLLTHTLVGDATESDLFEALELAVDAGNTGLLRFFAKRLGRDSMVAKFKLGKVIVLLAPSHTLADQLAVFKAAGGALSQTLFLAAINDENWASANALLEAGCFVSAFGCIAALNEDTGMSLLPGIVAMLEREVAARPSKHPEPVYERFLPVLLFIAASADMEYDVFASVADAIGHKPCTLYLDSAPVVVTHCERLDCGNLVDFQSFSFRVDLGRTVEFFDRWTGDTLEFIKVKRH